MTVRRRQMATPRKQLPFEEWPAADQAAWEELFREGDLLDGAGAACHWSAATRHGNRKHYARWLSWCAANGCLNVTATPWRRAGHEAVEGFARALLAEVAPRTVATILIGLKCVLQRMAPEADWFWLKMLTNRLDSWAMPSRSPQTPKLTAPAMFERTLGELDRLSRIQAPDARMLLAYRDTLIVALLLACPIRLRNLAMMEVGRQFSCTAGEWHLRFASGETKTGQPLHLLVPAALTSFVDRYLDRIRPAFRGADRHARVWAAQKGKPMACETIYDRVRKTTQALFGTALNPHAFRTIAATLLAETSPEDALHAPPLLGHRQLATTEKFYVRASQLSAARKVTAALQDIASQAPRRARIRGRGPRYA